MPIDTQVLRQAMRNWATGVTVVTAIFEGEMAGATVSSFTSVALEPPAVLVCLNKTTFVHEVMRKSGFYAVSFLAHDQQPISNRFAGYDPTITDRFAGLDLMFGETGSPFIPGALAWLDCKITHTLDTGTHTVFVGEVIHIAVSSEEAPLVYHNRAYKQLIENVTQPGYW